MKYVKSFNQIINEGASSSLSCVPSLFREPTSKLIEQGKNKLLIKASLGIIGRESDFGSSDRFKWLGPLKTLAAYVGVNTSVGYGQITPETAEEYGLSISELNTAYGSLSGVYRILQTNYNKAISVGYTTEPSSNFTEGTGNAALDISIVAFNAGIDKIVKYCKTSDDKLKRDCSLANTKTDDGLLVTSEFVKNYLPNFGTERWDKVNITSHGYVKEVANRINNFSCF